ncbi:MAG: peptide chain release factor N(5)-glutamine methyltransferase [Chloroflexi bacterium]|nr:peptide chain release factor N(5)-glutamine methyltransferase [Chloroflexota bacterium]
MNRARETLAANDIEDPALESELLLRHVLGISRVQLYLELEHELTPEQSQKFQRFIERRLKQEPSAYITGHREFYGLDFSVSPDVLIPRPESELLVERALRLAQNQNIAIIADIGTGSGAIAIRLALSLPQVKIYATDISTASLAVARNNCQKHCVTGRVHLLAGDLLEPLPEPVDLIIANLPYVSASALSQLTTFNFEPELALNGGPDGLEQIRRLCTCAGSKLNPGGSLLFEIGQGQSQSVTALLRGVFPSAEITVSPDLSGIDRVVLLKTW